MKIGFSQLDDGVIFSEQTTPVNPPSVAGLQHLHSEGVPILGHPQLASMGRGGAVAEGEARAALCRNLPTPDSEQVLVFWFIGTCESVPEHCITPTYTDILKRTDRKQLHHAVEGSECTPLHFNLPTTYRSEQLMIHRNDS